MNGHLRCMYFSNFYRGASSSVAATGSDGSDQQRQISAKEFDLHSGTSQQYYATWQRVFSLKEIPVLCNLLRVRNACYFEKLPFRKFEFRFHDP